MGAQEISSLETWLWDAASSIRGPVEAAKFKDYILPLIFLKRLSDVFEDEVTRIAEELDTSFDDALEEVELDHDLVRFYIPPEARWSYLQKLPEPTWANI